MKKIILALLLFVSTNIFSQQTIKVDSIYVINRISDNDLKIEKKIFPTDVFLKADQKSFSLSGRNQLSFDIVLKSAIKKEDDKIMVVLWNAIRNDGKLCVVSLSFVKENNLKMFSYSLVEKNNSNIFVVYFLK